MEKPAPERYKGMKAIYRRLFAAMLLVAVAMAAGQDMAASYPETSYVLDGRRLVRWTGPERRVDFRDDAVLARVSAVADYAFAGTAVEEVLLPDRLMIVPVGMFEGCVGLEKVRLGRGTRFIREAAFAGCKSLTSLDFPQGLLYIGPFAFDGSGLESADLSGTEVLEYGEDAFARCVRLRSVELGATEPLEVGRNLFRGCRSLAEVSVPPSWQRVGAGMFAECPGLQRVDLEGDLKEIGDSAFTDCSGLRGVNFGRRIESIGRAAFAGCGSLRLLYMPENLEAVGDYGFAGCRSLEMVFFGPSVCRIGTDAFAGCDSLREITLGADEPPQVWEDAFGDVYEPDVLLRVPVLSESDYRVSRSWQQFNINPMGGMEDSAVYPANGGDAILYSLEGRRVRVPGYVDPSEVATLTGYTSPGFYILVRPGQVPVKVVIR